MKSSSSYSIEDLKADPEADYSNQKLNNGQTGKDHPQSNTNDKTTFHQAVVYKLQSIIVYNLQTITCLKLDFVESVSQSCKVLPYLQIG